MYSSENAGFQQRDCHFSSPESCDGKVLVLDGESLGPQINAYPYQHHHDTLVQGLEHGPCSHLSWLKAIQDILQTAFLTQQIDFKNMKQHSALLPLIKDAHNLALSPRSYRMKWATAEPVSVLSSSKSNQALQGRAMILISGAQSAHFHRALKIPSAAARPPPECPLNGQPVSSAPSDLVRDGQTPHRPRLRIKSSRTARSMRA